MDNVRCTGCGWTGTRHHHATSPEQYQAKIRAKPCPRCTTMRALLDQALAAGNHLPKVEAVDRLVLELQALVGRVTPRQLRQPQ